MNLGSALFKRILEEKDLDTWSNLRKHYLPSEFSTLYDVIAKQVDLYHKLPSFEELKLSTRDPSTLEKIYAIEVIEVDAEPFLLLDYIKNEFAQKETLHRLHKYVENSIGFETAQETIDSLYNIIAQIEERVDLGRDEESMQRINPFPSEDELNAYIPLGLNAEFDSKIKFKPTDYILMGGKRGSGKSITCSNLANYVYESGKSVLYFTIEMPTREVLQRQIAIGAKVPFSKVKYRSLDNHEWMRVAKWWAGRYQNGDVHLESYKEHRNFNQFHEALQKEPLTDVQLHIVYDPSLTLPKLKAEAMKLVRKLGNVGLVIVDYVNQVKRSNDSHDKFDWKDQIYVSTSIKELAGILETPFFSPYQIDAEGEARFAKGILDSADAAFTLTAGPESILFSCSKMRDSDDEVSFSSVIDWNTLSIGPENGPDIVVEEEKPAKSGKKFGNSKKPEKEADKPLMDAIYDDRIETVDLPWGN